MDIRIEQEKTITQQLRKLFKAIQAHSKSIEKSCGLSSVRLWMLFEISSTEGIKVSELASILSIHRSTCSNMLDKLEDKNLIYRKRSKSDQRAVHLYITEEGEAVLAKAPSAPEGILSASLGKLSGQQLTELEQSFGLLLQAMHAEDDQAGLIPIQMT